MLLLAKVPQTGQFVCSCLAPKQPAAPRLGYLFEGANIPGDGVFVFFLGFFLIGLKRAFMSCSFVLDTQE